MGLRFGRSGTNSGPRNEIGNVLGSDWIQQFRGGRDSEIYDISKKVPGYAQPFVDIFRAVEVRVHDQTFPTQRCARFLEIDAHNQANAVFYPLLEGREALTIFQAAIRVVDRAGPDHEQETVIVAKDDSVDFLSGLRNEFRLRVRFGDLFYELARCRERGRLGDIDV